MAQCIIYPRGGGVAVLICHGANGAPLCDLPLDEIARKDVPAGVPYLIVDEADLPEDRSQRDLWTADFSEPHGHGIGAFAWFKEQLLVEIDELLATQPPQGDPPPPEGLAAHAAFIAAIMVAQTAVSNLPDADPSPQDSEALFAAVPAALASAWATYQEALPPAEEEPATGEEEPTE